LLDVMHSLGDLADAKNVDRFLLAGVTQVGQ
jgi:hypothetical protein